MFQSGNVKTMRRCYFVGHTPAELLRRKFIKDSRLSEGAFTTLHHNCYNEFLLFHSHYDQFAHFVQVAKSRLTLSPLLAGKPDSVNCLCTLGWLGCNQHWTVKVFLLFLRCRALFRWTASPLVNLHWWGWCPWEVENPTYLTFEVLCELFSYITPLPVVPYKWQQEVGVWD